MFFVHHDQAEICERQEQGRARPDDDAGAAIGHADHIVGGAEWSTLAHDAFPTQEFDFMLANPPYGKSWKKDLEALGGKDNLVDSRFKVMHAGEELSLVTRSSDGQMLFLANMAAKMNRTSVLGSCSRRRRRQGCRVRGSSRARSSFSRPTYCRRKQTQVHTLARCA